MRNRELLNMKPVRKLLSIICIIASFIPVYGQKDTLTADGLYLKYNHPSYRGNVTTLTMERIRNKDLYVGISKDSDMNRGELARVTKRMGLTYKILPQYIISEEFGLEDPPANPVELHQTANNVITSQWIHEDGECILFIKCYGGRPNKSYNKLPENRFNWIKYTLGMGSFLDRTTEKQMQKIKKKITIWPSEKAKNTFNAHYVITYPIKNKKSIYMGKYTHKFELIMIKWEQNLTVSFLVTKKGRRNIDKYIKDVEEAFWFED